MIEDIEAFWDCGDICVRVRAVQNRFWAYLSRTEVLQLAGSLEAASDALKKTTLGANGSQWDIVFRSRTGTAQHRAMTRVTVTAFPEGAIMFALHGRGGRDYRARLNSDSAQELASRLRLLLHSEHTY